MSHTPYFANAAVMMLDPADIDPDLIGRIGLYYPAKAEALAVLIDAHGQNDPIKVVARGNAAKTKWMLVAGRHRLEACRMAGLQVSAIEVLAGNELSKFGKDNLRDIQASENMDRRELAPLERAMFVHVVAEAAKARMAIAHPDKSQQEIARAAQSRKVYSTDLQKADMRTSSTVDNLSTVYSWKPETAAACGLGLKDVQRSLRIHDCVVVPCSDMIDAFKDHPVAQVATSLLEIAVIKSEADRRKVVRMLIDGPKDLAFVLQACGLRDATVAPDQFTKMTSQIIGGWERLGTAEKRRFIPQFVASISAGMKDMLRDALNEELPQ